MTTPQHTRLPDSRRHPLLRDLARRLPMSITDAEIAEAERVFSDGFTCPCAEDLCDGSEVREEVAVRLLPRLLVERAKLRDDFQATLKRVALAAMKAKGVSQSAMARKIGVSPPEMNRTLRRTTLTVDRATRIASALGMEIRYDVVFVEKRH